MHYNNVNVAGYFRNRIVTNFLEDVHKNTAGAIC
jgi:hypothetical protein